MTRLRMFSVILAVLVIGIAALIAYGAYLERRVEYWNNRIDELCAEDGGKNVGLRVYERVMAPESYIRPASGAMPADIRVPWRLPSKTAKPNEPIVEEAVDLGVIRHNDPRVVKYSFRITRVADEKVLGEEIRYLRTGGGIPMPDPSEVHDCPDIPLSRIGTRAIYSQVFINHPLNRSE
ncbi:hypothetical protein [Piscinibacter sakaiensis]|uniref:hypothetical protein n=1 Tax=Piscinibacter sakaiensis TaxID=1547922 RepID=UPI003AAE4FBA